MLRRAPALAEEVAHQDDRRGPHRSAEHAVKEERAKAHAARACYKRFENAGDREEAGREDGLAAVPREEPFDLLQALRSQLYIPPPLQDERSSCSVADPVTDLIPDDSPKDANRNGVPEVKIALLDQYTCGQEYGHARERDTRGPYHHAEEDNQVPVVLDQGVELIHGNSKNIGSMARGSCLPRPSSSCAPDRPQRSRTPRSSGT